MKNFILEIVIGILLVIFTTVFNKYFKDKLPNEEKAKYYLLISLKYLLLIVIPLFLVVYTNFTFEMNYNSIFLLSFSIAYYFYAFGMLVNSKISNIKLM